MQCDFSATPFFGKGTQKKYFVHIVYDYDLIEAMHAMLVKQLFLENRKQATSVDLDFRAKREKNKHGEKLDITGLSRGQKLLLEIGRKKLESLSQDFQSSQISKKPVMMVLCEETSVAGMVKEYFQNIADPCNMPYDERKVMEIHTDLKEEELYNARSRLDKIDDNDDPLNVVISVLMLREGFDRRNISVIVILRASEADLLLEQIIGRGLRLMFPRTESEIIWKSKIRALEDIKNNKPPRSSFDILFVVDHPRFEKFYQNLRKDGYLIGSGNISNVRTLGDIIPVEATPTRISNYDIAWPVQIFENGNIHELATIDVSKFPSYNNTQSFCDLQKYLRGLETADNHVDKKTKAWKFNKDVFSYNLFLLEASHAVAEEGKIPIFSSHLADIAKIIDEYVSNYLFMTKIDFDRSKNSIILNYIPVFNFIVKHVRITLLQLATMKNDYVGKWRKLSDVHRLMLTEKNSIECNKAIYPRQGFSTKGDNFEKKFMLDVLEQSPEVLSYARFDKRHGFSIPYRDDHGILQRFGVDFIIKTNEKIFLLETRSDEESTDNVITTKAKATHNWCHAVSIFSPIGNMPQAGDWEYLVLSRKLFESNTNLSFNKFVPLCKELRNRMSDGRF
jgi:type III restriction enzyme